MGKFKVCVYAICKNEGQFVNRWLDSMAEADEVVVLDTGSTDDTVERLRAGGARVAVETISPWRFDTARNRSMELLMESGPSLKRRSMIDRFGMNPCLFANTWKYGLSSPCSLRMLSGRLG